MRSESDFQEERNHEIGDSLEIVVADTSPLNYLVQIGCDRLLPSLYQRVLVPPAVIAELRHRGAPPSVARWVSELPEWVRVVSPIELPDERLSLLDVGERYAIQLAIEIGATTILVDDFEARREALDRGFVVTGTLGVLLEAYEAGLYDARHGLELLTNKTNFRISRQVRRNFLSILGEDSSPS